MFSLPFVDTYIWLIFRPGRTRVGNEFDNFLFICHYFWVQRYKKEGHHLSLKPQQKNVIWAVVNQSMQQVEVSNWVWSFSIWHVGIFISLFSKCVSFFEYKVRVRVTQTSNIKVISSTPCQLSDASLWHLINVFQC